MFGPGRAHIEQMLMDLLGEREWGLKVSYAFVVGSYSLEAGARTGASRQESESNAQVAVRVSTQCSQGKASPEKNN